MSSRRRQRDRFELSSIFNAWVFVAGAAIGLCLTASTLGLLWLTRPAAGPRGSSTAILSVIRMPTIEAQPATQTPTPSPTEGSGMPPAPAPGTISLGGYVQITGTSGEGLRLRSAPGFTGNVLVLGKEAEVFQVADGPKEVDGYAWWYLTGASDSKRAGWAVANYLSVTQKP